MIAGNMDKDGNTPINNAYTGGDIAASKTPAQEIKKADERNDSGIFSTKGILLVVVIFAIIRFYIAEPFLVFGKSMEPNFKGGDYLIVDEISYKFKDPQRGDVIVLTPPMVEQQKDHFIKRIVGLPGETIIVAGSKVTIKNSQYPDGIVLDEPYVAYQSTKEAIYELGPDQYFVMGDNRAVSDDSRHWGPLKRSEITGKPLLRLFPLENISLFPGKTDIFKNI
jgi:signal peptidase I